MVLIKYLTHFDSLIRDQNIEQKRIPLKIRFFLSLVVHLKEFGPS
jgi:hypothetical protein